MKKILFASILSFFTIWVNGQQKISLKDSLDHKLDLSDWVLEANGFIPVPMLITEPALGGIGGALFGVFIDKNTPYTDTINGKIVKTRAKPNIYGAGGAYTANGTWFVGGMMMGVIKKWRANYRIGTAYADVNLKFYRETQLTGEKSFEFNLRSFPINAHLLKQFGRSDWFAGLSYLFLNTELARTNAEFHTPKEIKSIVSRLGILVDYDGRDNIFTPDKGFRWNTLVAASSDVIGSDYKYESVNSAVIGYVPITPTLISGYRIEYQEVFGDFPFYIKPYVNMRGIPAVRYQGEITTLAETEWRWDFTPRYSVVGFVGTAKALDNWSDFDNSPWRVSGGLGGRYLIARKLKLRMGLDVAHGPESWGYYVVIGSNWLR